MLLREFFIVTMTSLYFVTLDEKDIPYATKLGERKDVKNPIPLNHTLNQRDKASLMSIGRKAVFFVPEGGGLSCLENNIEYVNTRHWKNQTGEIVGLFLREEDAQDCLTMFNPKGYDTMWITQTRETLEAIGDDHPVFKICRGSMLGIPFAI